MKTNNQRKNKNYNEESDNDKDIEDYQENDDQDNNDKDEEDIYTVEAILDKKKFGNTFKYLIKWENYSHDTNTWEPIENLYGVMEMVEEFEKNLKIKQLKAQNNTNTSNNNRNGTANSNGNKPSYNKKANPNNDNSYTDNEIDNGFNSFLNNNSKGNSNNKLNKSNKTSMNRNGVVETFEKNNVDISEKFDEFKR